MLPNGSCDSPDTLRHRTVAPPPSPMELSADVVIRLHASGSTPQRLHRNRKHENAPEAETTLPAAVAFVPTPSRSRRVRKPPSTGIPVLLHVYDLGPVSRFLVNSWAIFNKEQNCMGVFHVGVEVLGVEFSFQAMSECPDGVDVSGLTWHTPKSHPRHVYRETVDLGMTSLSVSDISLLLEQLEKDWPARTYNCLTKNCTDFAEILTSCLRCSNPFPQWVHGLAKGLSKHGSLNLTGLIPCCMQSCEVGSYQTKRSFGDAFSGCTLPSDCGLATTTPDVMIPSERPENQAHPRVDGNSYKNHSLV